MKNRAAVLLLLLLCTPFLLLSDNTTEAKGAMLYSSLDPTSIREHIAFYKLFSNSPCGKKAFANLIVLLGGEAKLIDSAAATIATDWLTEDVLHQLMSLVQANSDNASSPSWFERDWKSLSQIGSNLAHRKLKGHRAQTKEEILQLSSEEIDFARALLLSQFSKQKDAEQKIVYYEALLDLMALQVQARLPPNATAAQKITQINTLLFEELQFRFPPHSLSSEKIDLYSFLPSVLDSQRGVCLGVSSLYLCLAQRLDLPLEIITPPGHIYIRYRKGDTTINIETTARGIDIPSQHYHTVDFWKLCPQPLKSVVGMAFYNQAVMWHYEKEYVKAIEGYRQALQYMPGDLTTQELLAFALLSVDQEQEAKHIFISIAEEQPLDTISKLTTPSDYLHGLVDKEGVAQLIMKIDETREALVDKKNQIEKTLKRYPCFRDGWMYLAMTWIELGRKSEALHALEQYHRIDPTHPLVEYYLALLYFLRYDYTQAWTHLKYVEQLTQKHDYQPYALRQLQRELQRINPQAK